MLIKNNLKYILYFVLISISFFYDLVLALDKYPIITLTVCAILIIYERVSPFIYSSR